MPKYLCNNCNQTAEHPAPGKCEPCGLDPKKDQRDAAYLTELAALHFDAPHAKIKGRGVGYAACNPKLPVGAPRCLATGERDHVTCDACRATPAFAAAEGVAVGPTELLRLGALAPAPEPAE